LSYAQLDAQANRLAHRLRRLGVGPEVRVGLCLERSPLMVVALLAVLKAGGAYLPLDPDCPRERLALLLREAQAHLLLTQQRLRQRLPDGPAPVLCLDSDEPHWSSDQAEQAECSVRPEHLAYLLYTSGSTGTPKGRPGQPRQPGPRHPGTPALLPRGP